MLLTDKRTFRKAVLDERNALSDRQRTEYSEQVLANLLCLTEFSQAKTVMGYMNFGSEFLAERWCQQVLNANKRLILPKVDPISKCLKLYEVSDFSLQLTIGAYGIREPDSASCIQLNSLNEVELVLLPGVAFTRQGARLGYGGGFYDKLLATVAKPPLLVAAAYSLQLVDYLPEEETDKRVDWLMTEQEAIFCSVQN